MRHIHRQPRIVIRVARVGNAQGTSHRLQLAVAIRHADGAYMVTLHQQQLDSHAAIECQLGRRGHDRHAFLHQRRTRGKQTVSARRFDQAHTARTHRAQSLQITERGNMLAVGARHLQDGVSFVRGHQFPIDANRNRFNRLGLASISPYPSQAHFPVSSQIAAQAAAALFERFLRAKAGDHFLLRMRARSARQRVRHVAAREARLAGRLMAVLELRKAADPSMDGSQRVADLTSGDSSILRAACLPPLIAFDILDAPVMTSPPA